MPKYLVQCDTGFCGVNETVVVTAEDESEAEGMAQEWWNETVAPSVTVEKEFEDGDEDAEGYQEIN